MVRRLGLDLSRVTWVTFASCISCFAGYWASNSLNPATATSSFLVVRCSNVYSCQKICKYTQRCHEVAFHAKSRSCFLLEPGYRLSTTDMSRMVLMFAEKAAIQVNHPCYEYPCGLNATCSQSQLTDNGYNCHYFESTECSADYDQTYCTKHYTSQKVTADQAEALCAADGGHLVEVADAAMHQYIQQQLIAANIATDVWIEGTDTGGGGTNDFVNRNQLPLLYIAWSPDDPDGGNQDCMRHSHDTGWAFQDDVCGNTYHFICQL